MDFDILHEFRYFAVLITFVTPRVEALKSASVGKELRLTERKASSAHNGLVSRSF